MPLAPMEDERDADDMEYAKSLVNDIVPRGWMTSITIKRHELRIEVER